VSAASDKQGRRDSTQAAWFGSKGWTRLFLDARNTLLRVCLASSSLFSKPLSLFRFDLFSSYLLHLFFLPAGLLIPASPAVWPAWLRHRDVFDFWCRRLAFSIDA
jgi:hypothetical protein